jgi:hypothetical protein
MNKFKIVLISLLLSGLCSFAGAQNFTYKIARLKYEGGGNWYVSPTSLPNLINFCNQNLGTHINPEEAVVEPGSPDIFNYPFLHMTGNGNVVFSQQEADNLRKYLTGGGFLNINDSYGMDKFVRTQMKKVFPELEFVELPFSHPIYHQKYNFDKGVPKIHLHDGKAPQGFGLIYNGRLVCFYDYEADIGDGWEDPEVHHDPEENRQKALQMGANILYYVLMGK